ncbi:MAG TPA: O-antigen ligase family protein [Thermoanaerobaculia bacterium]|nr:O-antigen ligase family protein [Thermoanaerobaculia bacterium]
MLWVLVALAMLLVPFIFMRPAVDVFRTPKDVVFETLALAMFAVLCVAPAVSAGGIRTAEAAVPTLAVLWTGVVCVLSLQRDVSFFKPLYVFCLAVFFVAALITTRARGVSALVLAIAPALVNAIVAFLQSTGSERFLITKDAVARRLWTSGFIGNPNELGGYFVLPLLASIAAAIAWPRLRIAFIASALVLAGGVIAAQSVTPVIATGAGVAAMMLLPRARTMRWIAIAGLVLLVAAVSFHSGARARMSALITAARTGQAVELTSYRLPAWAVALDMFRERPLVGVGPGVFASRFMSYKIDLDVEHPSWIRIGWQNFGEAHNDHLQLLAEAGLPAYLLFLASLFLIGRVSFAHREETTERETFAHAFAFPAAAAFGVLALAHFPMHLTSTMVPALFLAALCFSWTEHDESA